MKKTYSLRSIAAAVALGVAVAGGAVGAPAGVDTAPVASAQAGDQISNIDTTKSGSITVNKRLNPATTGSPTGETDTTVGGQPLSGVEFRVQRVQADLSTNTGFQAATALTPGTATVMTGDGAVDRTGTTANGVAPFTGLPVGVYLVTETNTTNANIGGTPVSGAIIPSQPFLVFVPMTATTSTEWNYDVQVYPKNSSTAADKTVEDADDNVGDALAYTITSGIPSVATGDTLSKYIVRDDVDTTKLDFTQAQADAAVVKIVSTTGTETLLARGTDFTVAPLAPAPAPNASKTRLEVTFTPAGLSKLQTAGSTAKVSTTFEATIKAIGAGDGVIKNDAVVIVNNGSSESDTETPTNEVETWLGKLKIVKTDDAATPKPLSGAVFELYHCTGDSDDPTLGNQITITAPVAPGQTPVEVSSWTTQADGTVTIDGLHVTDFENNADVPEADRGKYCLVETKAPVVDGVEYELLPKPVMVTFTRADLAPTNDDTDAVTRPVTIKNVVSTTGKLPLTGGLGIGLIVTAGLALLAGAALYAKRASGKVETSA